MTPLLAWLGVYWQVPLWLLPTRRLQVTMVRRYFAQYSEALGKGETPFSAIMVGTRGLRGPWLNQSVAYHRVKVRLRMTVLYYYAELHNLLVSGTDNKTELAVGFFVKYGDAAADIDPLASLYKTQVRALAAYLGVPDEIIARPPSPDILPGLTDEQAMGLDYSTLGSGAMAAGTRAEPGVHCGRLGAFANASTLCGDADPTRPIPVGSALRSPRPVLVTAQQVECGVVAG